MIPANTNMAISNGLAQRMGVNPYGPMPVQGTAMGPVGAPAPVGAPNFLGPPAVAPGAPGVGGVMPTWGSGGMPVRAPIAYPVGGAPGAGTAAANPIIRNGLRRYLGNAY